VFPGYDGRGMIDLLAGHGGRAAEDAALLRALAAHEAAVLRSAGGGDPRLVGQAEKAVRARPQAAFAFDAAGMATLSVGTHSWCAGLFESCSLHELRQRAAARAATRRHGPVRFWVLDGASAATDVASLQAHGDDETLFQVASQFDCLEAPGPALTSVERYFSDPTQGPRASISAFPGTLLRHYCAPGPRGERFVQTDDGQQIELLQEVCDPGVARVRNGYLLADQIAEPRRFLAALETRFEAIRVGVHDEAEVVLGYDWAGAVEASPRPRIGQVFTSTLAAGSYGSATGVFQEICSQLLRAAYLGTLLAALALDRARVVLTLIGGGVFGNAIEVIWQALTWALDQVAPLATRGLVVVLNGRDLGRRMERSLLLHAIRARDGVLLSWPRGGAPALHR
jgi:hypothetical protein